MYCSKCGTQIPDGTRFCSNCGAQIIQQTSTPPQPVPQPVAPVYQPMPQQPVYSQQPSAGGSKTTLIVALAAIIVIVIVVVAAVVLMGGGGVSGPTDSIVCDARMSGSSQGVPMQMTATTKIKKPDKMRLEASGSVMGMSVQLEMRLEGNTMYMYDPTGMYGGSSGNTWIKINAQEADSTGILDTAWAQIGDKTPEQLEAEMRSSMGDNMGVAPDVSCRYVASIPDSEFRLPPGASVMEY